MKHVIIGTAGHVDHGKTLLVKALTGIDTDRLVEEKKRGITIELGFAHLDFDDGTQAGIVDVPGHEKFIKNMLAGAGGIDLAMLVVAADEGFMPQTVEHLGILSLLGIQDGLVVITKADMVDPEWVEMVKDDVAAQVEGTFLEGKPVFTVSAYTGQGIAELREALTQLVHKASEKNLRTPFRLPIDRVFSVDGFGTVVTGTLIEGSVSEGDMAEILPTGVEARVRNLQVHGKDVDTAFAGQRVAVNLAGIRKAAQVVVFALQGVHTLGKCHNGAGHIVATHGLIVGVVGQVISNVSVHGDSPVLVIVIHNTYLLHKSQNPGASLPRCCRGGAKGAGRMAVAFLPRYHLTTIGAT